MRFFAFALLLAAALAVARPCRADDLTWAVTRSPEASACPDGAALAASVAQAREPSSRPEAVEVAFDHAGAAYTATIRIRGARAGVRSLADASASCAALGVAVVATVLVLLDEAERAPAPPAPVRAEPAESPPADVKYSALRLGFTANASYLYFHRSATSPDTEQGLGLGGELRLFPHSRHGLTVGYSVASGIFGPGVQLIDAAYTYALVEPRPLDGSSYAVYVDVGPALGIVSQATPAPDHSVLGGRASIDLDVLVWNFTVGISGSYRGGVPLGRTPDAWEGAVSASLRLGFLLDFDSTGR